MSHKPMPQQTKEPLLPELILIAGSPRSGTSLMQHILETDAHTNPALGEIKFLGCYLNAFHKSKEQFESHNHVFFESYDEFVQHNRQFLGGIFQQLSQRLNCSHLVLKFPLISQFTPEFLELFPQTRCVLMLRDLRDIVVSLLQVGERLRASNHPSQHSLENLPQVIEYAHKHYSPLYPLLEQEPSAFSLLPVRYEELVNNPHKILKVLRAFTGLELSNYAPDQDWQDYKKHQPSEFDRAWISQLNGKAISAKSVGKYQRKLTRQQIWQVEKLGREYFEHFEYPVLYDLPLKS